MTLTGPDRVPCAIPGCGRTMKGDPTTTRMLCGRHWRMGPKRCRARYTLALRREKRDARWQRVRFRVWEAVRVYVLEEVRSGMVP